MASIAPDQLFVIVCPVCRGHIAATGSLCGRDACCPLCASLFHVPFHAESVEAVTTTPPEPSLAEDWGRVLDKLAPSGEKAVSLAPEPEPTSDFELPAEVMPEPAPVAPPEPTPPQRHTSTAALDSIPMEPIPDEVVSEAAPETPAPVPAPSTDWIDQVLESSGSSGSPETLAAPEGYPHLGPALLAPAEQDLTFREPVRTIRQGDTVIELRRLTPEERKVRRFRRNLMMIVVAVSILLAIVLIFGVPAKTPR